MLCFLSYKKAQRAYIAPLREALVRKLKPDSVYAESNNIKCIFRVRILSKCLGEYFIDCDLFMTSVLSLGHNVTISMLAALFCRTNKKNRSESPQNHDCFAFTTDQDSSHDCYTLG